MTLLPVHSAPLTLPRELVECPSLEVYKNNWMCLGNKVVFGQRLNSVLEVFTNLTNSVICDSLISKHSRSLNLLRAADTRTMIARPRTSGSVGSRVFSRVWQN